MFVVFVNDGKGHKELLFVTELRRTASSFCDNFNSQINELTKIYMSDHYLYHNDKSGWNAKVKQLTDRINITTDKIEFGDTNIMIQFGYHFEYEEVCIV